MESVTRNSENLYKHSKRTFSRFRSNPSIRVPFFLSFSHSRSQTHARISSNGGIFHIACIKRGRDIRGRGVCFRYKRLYQIFNVIDTLIYILSRSKDICLRNNLKTLRSVNNPFAERRRGEERERENEIESTQEEGERRKRQEAMGGWRRRNHAIDGRVIKSCTGTRPCKSIRYAGNGYRLLSQVGADLSRRELFSLCWRHAHRSRNESH